MVFITRKSCFFFFRRGTELLSCPDNFKVEKYPIHIINEEKISFTYH